MSDVTSDDGSVDWTTFFQSENAYMKSYLQEIILSILEESEESGSDVKRIMFVEEQKVSQNYMQANTAAAAKADDDQDADAEDGQEVPDF